MKFTLTRKEDTLIWKIFQNFILLDETLTFGEMYI